MPDGQLMQRVEQLLSRAVGLNVASVGSAVIARAVRERMKHRQITDEDAYVHALFDDRSELQALIEVVVVSETWFFRNHEALLRAADLLTREWSVAKRGALRRILSVPCATGEEPYSIAMALAERGLTPKEAQIDAIDVSHRALAVAERALYGKNAFRGEMTAVCERYTRRGAAGIELLPEIRGWVRFSQGNLVAPDFHPMASSYNVIFCRNVLIYLERAAQVHVLTTLHQLLSPNGYLFVGPAEVALAAECGFRVAEPAAAFVCQKVPRELWRSRQETSSAVAPRKSGLTLMRKELPAARSKVAGTPNVQLPRSILPFTEGPHTSPAAMLSAQTTPVGTVVEGVAGTAGGVDAGQAVLVRAQQLADEGRLTEAADACLRSIRESGPAAQAYYLLGLVQDARGGGTQAVNYYRKALFLDPNHVHALTQLAMHAQRSGDTTNAERLRMRTQRIQQRQEQ